MPCNGPRKIMSVRKYKIFASKPAEIWPKIVSQPKLTSPLDVLSRSRELRISRFTRLTISSFTRFPTACVAALFFETSEGNENGGLGPRPWTTNHLFSCYIMTLGPQPTITSRHLIVTLAGPELVGTPPPTPRSESYSSTTPSRARK